MPGTKGHIPECVGGNFGHARTIEEALHNLQQVESLVDFISNAIEERISLENSRLQKLNSKVEFFKRQIDVVASNPQRATTVYSAAHFPRSEHDVLYDYSTALFPYQPSESTKKDFYIPKPEKEFKNGLKLNDASEIFVHLYESAKKDVAGKKPHYGLGSLPSNISSISSTLLFNTQNNPYFQYKNTDNLEGISRSVEKQEEVTDELEAAPQTIIDGDMLPRFSVDDLEFKPTIGELPAFDLPNVLPNLPGIADINWDFSNAQTSTIAPSKMSQKPPKPLDKSVSKRKSLVKVKDETVRSEISTQVPTPPVIQNSQKDSTEKKRSTSNLSASMIPPPAPAAPVPPPPPAPKIADSSQVKKVVKIDNDRASLLESIRNPSIKLKKVTVDREMRKKPLASDQEIKASTPGDIMDLLREKLRQRQKFISGKGEQESTTAANSERQKIGDDW